MTHGKKRFLKNKWYEADEPRIVRVRDPVVHAEQRRTLSHAFSSRALRDQEDVVHQYVDLLLEQLNSLGACGRIPVNATEVWNWLTFDIIGKTPQMSLSFPPQTIVSDLLRRGLGVWRALRLPLWWLKPRSQYELRLPYVYCCAKSSP